jgi:hypothetical protein
MSDLETLIEFLNHPLGSAEKTLTKFAEIPGAIRRGQGLEQFVFIKGARANRILMVAHADTVWDRHYIGNKAPAQQLVLHKGIIQNKHGGLGADDRAGCAIIWLLRELGHSILITHGEEDGRLGSNWLMSKNPDIADEINKSHQFVVQLDRMNGTDFKCYSVGTDNFRKYVSQTTGYTEPDRLSYTDIVTLCRDICGVNLSVGYKHEHTEVECLAVDEWQNTLDICRKWLAECGLPVFRQNEKG